MEKSSDKRSVRFGDLGLSKDLVSVLTRLNFTIPTPIQEKAIPEALSGRDVIGVAQTGTGKTLAFFLPMLHNIDKNKGMGLIVVPTRELAHQVSEEINKVGGKLGFKTVLLVGGANMDRQLRQLKRRPHIIIATPGRLNDHIERRTVRLGTVKTLVLDEADRMLDMGFAPQIDRILEAVPAEHQTLLFSATMPRGVTRIAEGYMKDPVRVEVKSSGVSAKNIDQGMFFVEASSKFNLLGELLREYSIGPVLVFCRTKHGTKKMAQILNREGIGTEELHSNRTLNQRRRALENFKRGKSRVLVATDVAARGIDVKEISLVVNYDLPDQNEDYVHRIGRTGRAGHKGKAISFAMPDQYGDVKAIERLIGIDIPILDGALAYSTADIEKFKSRYSRPSKRSYGGGRGRRGGGGRGGRQGGGFGGKRGGGGGSQMRRKRKGGAAGGGAGGNARQRRARSRESARASNRNRKAQK